MSKRPKFDFQALIKNDLAPKAEPVAEAVTAEIVPIQSVAPSESKVATEKHGTLKQRARQQSLYLEAPVYEVLREIAFTERTSMHALFLEGIDAVLKKRGSPSIANLLRQKS